jgi:hypothetical protein
MEKHVSIWQLWIGSMSDTQKPHGSGTFTLLGEVSESEDGVAGPGLCAALSARALCGLKLVKDGWTPAPLHEESRDFLFPGGACVHLRRESCEVSYDTHEAVSEAMKSMTICGFKVADKDAKITISMSDLEALLKR